MERQQRARSSRRRHTHEAVQRRDPAVARQSDRRTSVYRREVSARARRGGDTLTRTLLCLALVALVGRVPVHGHHSFAASYLEDQLVSVEGDVVELEYRNPHSWVHIQARDNFGRMQKVSAEWASPVRLNQQGVTRDALKPGDRV